MNVLILGKGSREHAIAKACLKSKLSQNVYVSPANSGMNILDSLQTIEDFSKEELLDKIIKNKIDLVIVGSEAFIENSYVDFLKENKIQVFGPIKKAGALESSKLFFKQIASEEKILTANYKHFDNAMSLKEFCNSEILKRPLVLKWDYLAEGKGVYVCKSKEELSEAYTAFEGLYNKQSKFSVLVEDCLVGKEFSSFVMVSGQKVLFFESACDYKRRFDKNKGPNTGGMGAYSPSNLMERDDIEKLSIETAEKVLKGLNKRGIPYTGFLFFGFLISDKKPYLLEINVRFGDPETQAILPRLKSDFLATICDLMNEDSNLSDLDWSEDHCVHIVKSKKTYPKTDTNSIYSDENKIILNFKNQDGLHIYFAGVSEREGNLYASGGRVLGLSSLDSSLELAKKKAYSNLDSIRFNNEDFRKDIGEQYD